jgi:hypothetical protein
LVLSRRCLFLSVFDEALQALHGRFEFGEPFLSEALRADLQFELLLAIQQLLDAGLQVRVCEKGVF